MQVEIEFSFEEKWKWRRTLYKIKGKETYVQKNPKIEKKENDTSWACWKCEGIPPCVISHLTVGVVSWGVEIRGNWYN